MMQPIEAVLWVAMLAMAILASHWLWSTLGLAIASQGLVANTSALVFVVSRQSDLQQGWSLLLAALTGGGLGLAHIGLLKATNKEVLLIASVLMTFLWSDLWLSLPAITGGSGGVVVQSNMSFALFCIVAATIGCVYLCCALLPKESKIFWKTSARDLGMGCGVLGISVSRLFGGGFAIAGCIFGLLGAAGALVTGIVTPNLFSTSWSLSVLAVVVAPKIPLVHRVLTLPSFFVLARWLLRDSLPASIGSSQLVEFTFPVTVLLWSRVQQQALIRGSS